MAVRLSSRLAAAAALVTPGNRLADVGTDHGYVPIALCEQGTIPCALALDVREGPLSAARRNIAAAGKQEQVETRLSDGLIALAPGEADTVLLAGMGGALIQRILGEGAPALAGVRELVLQPQSEIPAVRRFLRLSGYEITHETVVKEDGKFYVVLRAVPHPGGAGVWPAVSGGGQSPCVGLAAGEEECVFPDSAAAGGGQSLCTDSAVIACRQSVCQDPPAGGADYVYTVPEAIGGGQRVCAVSAAAGSGSQSSFGRLTAADSRQQGFTLEDAFGPVLLADRPGLWCEWIGAKLRETEAILAGLHAECEKHPENAKAAGRLAQLEARRGLLAAALEGTI